MWCRKTSGSCNSGMLSLPLLGYGYLQLLGTKLHSLNTLAVCSISHHTRTLCQLQEADLWMWQEQQEGKLKVSMTTWLWSGEMATSLWSMYSCLHTVTCLGKRKDRLYILNIITVSSPSKAPYLTLVALSVTHSDLHQLGQLCHVVRLVDNVHHHTFLVPGLPGRDVPGAAPTHRLWHLTCPRLDPHHVRLHLPDVHHGEHPHQNWGLHNILH